MDGIAVEVDLTFIERINSGDAFDQGRFPRAVVANKGHDLASIDLEIDFGERLNCTEVLGNLFCL